MTQNDNEQDLLKNAQRILDDGADNLDADTTSKLKKIRYQALEQKQQKFSWLTPYSTFAATASVMVLAMTLWFSQPPMVNDELVIEDMPLLSANEELEFFQELEFYNWLDDEEING